MEAEEIKALDEARRAQLTYAFLRIFRPLARILVQEQVPYMEFRDSLRMAFIEAALKYGMPGYDGPPSIAAIATRLGVPELEVRRLVENPEILNPPEPTNLSMYAAMLTVWATQPQFLGPYGFPRQLGLHDPPGGSFTDLVRTVRPDSDAAEIMDQMLRAGAIEQAGPNHVKMIGREMFLEVDHKGVPDPTISGAVFEHLGVAMANLAATKRFNMATPALEERLLERTVYNDKLLPHALVSAFKERLKKVMVPVLYEFDDFVVTEIARYEAIHGPTTEGVRVGVSVFEWVAEPEQLQNFGEVVVPTGVSSMPAWQWPPKDP